MIFVLSNNSKVKSFVWINKYSLSKRTTAYLAVDNAKADAGIKATSTDKFTGVAVGVNHTF